MKHESQRRDRSVSTPARSLELLDRGTEAGRADHRAVAAGEAARRDVVPARMVEVGEQQRVHPLLLHLASHGARGARDDRLRRPMVRICRRAARQAGKERGARLAARLHQEGAIRACRDLGQSEIEPGGRLRPGSHRDAEAGAARGAAIDRDDEGRGAPRLVVGIDMRAFQEHAVLDRDGMQVTGADADEGEALGARRLGGDGHRVAVAARARQAQHRRVQEALPRMRPDGISEQRVILAPGEAVGTAVLRVGPACRQIGDRGDVVIDDSLVAQRGADDAEAAAAQRRKQGVEPVAVDHGCGVAGHRGR